VNKATPIFLAVFLIGVAGLLIRVPLPGVQAEEDFQYRGENYTLELVEEAHIEGKYWGSFDLVSKEVTVATGDRGLWGIISTCSHELYHADYADSGKSMSEQKEHEEMPSADWPWNWKMKCMALSRHRLSSVSFF